MNNNLISRQIEKYISYKKALGYQIKIESQELRRFASYTVSIGYEGSLTKDIAFQWATLKPNYSQWYMARRMETIRTFAKYISVFDPMAQIPPNGMFGKCHGRTTPYIFTEQEICILMQASLNLYAPDGLRCKTISTAIGLLWSTGMRPNEVCQLMDDDVDLNDGLITIRETKFSKSRIIPIHETAISKLRSYVNDRDNLRRDFSDLHFLITTGSRKLVLRNFESALQVIRDQILIDKNEWDRRPPRLYDFRHTFACNTLLRWLNNGINIDRKIIYLSTYLGHVKVADTYWYLTGTPELLQLTSRNFEEFFYEGVSVMKNNDFQELLQNFFLKWMMGQKKVSPSTIQAYKDTFRILLKYMNEEHGVKAISISMEAIDADAIIGFLHYLENNRRNTFRTVNNRLAAIKSFMEYVSYECPEYSGTVRKIKAIPFRKVEKKEICYLTKEEMDILLNTCETKNPEGRRDYLILLLLYNSGMRVSEMISIKGKMLIFPIMENAIYELWEKEERNESFLYGKRQQNVFLILCMRMELKTMTICYLAEM